MAQDEPHGPDGFPLCKVCGAQRRVDNNRYPSACAECIALGKAGEPVHLAGDPEPDDTAPWHRRK